MDFRSDNVHGAHPKVLQALVEANAGPASSYGDDPWSERLRDKLQQVFEHELWVLPVTTGSAANSLALAAHVQPWQAVYCHHESHINVDECGGPEFFTGGAKLIDLPGEGAKIAPETVERAIVGEGFVHAVQPGAISITQATEMGRVYQPAEIAALSAVAKRHKMILHMDGARFANALVSLGCTAAEMTWKAGVDALSFGATKNGCLMAEAIILFDGAKADELAYRRKRAGQLLSKMRLASAQLVAYLEGDLWLANARHANAMARRLAEGLSRIGLPPLLPVEANELFVRLPKVAAKALQEAGYRFYDWAALGPDAWRLVTAFNTEERAVDGFLAAVRQAKAA
ncbi:MAG TPA: low specificity L-threonine aldolase [Kiloniellales bacterium]|nr:low specificity L-threonine aldolase [Kiloniellales bacterium]